MLFPTAYFFKYTFKRGKRLFKYTVEHWREMKAVASFSWGNFFSKLKEKQTEDYPIFNEEDTEEENLKDDVIELKKKTEQNINNPEIDTSLSSDALESKNNQSKKEENIINTDSLSESSSSDERDNGKQSKSDSKRPSHHIDSKKLKLKLDKIKAESLVFKNKWQFNDYERTLIEWMSLEDGNRNSFKKLLADWYFSTKNFKKALTLLKQILTLEPKNHKALRQVWEIHLEKWEFNIAEMLVKKAINLTPQNPKYYVTMVEILFNLDRLEEATWLMQKVIKLRPSNVTYLLWLASLCEKTWDIDDAKSCYLKVIHLDPTNDKARKKLKQFRA